MFSVTFTETFQDAGQFAEFAAAFKDFCDDYYSGSPRRKRAATLPTAPPAVPPAPIPDSSEDMGAARFFKAPPIVDAASVTIGAEAAGATVSVPLEAPAAAEPKKRIRRTREQIAADEAAKAAAKAEGAAVPFPDLPRAHGGSNSGTTAPLPTDAPMPVEGDTLDIPEGEVTIDDVRRLWSQTLMLEATEAPALALLGTLGLGRARDAQPQHYRPLCEGLARIAKAAGA